MPLGPVDPDVPYVLGGSVASSLVGEPRATMDVDFAVRLRRTQLDTLVAALGTAYYVSRDAALDAVTLREYPTGPRRC